MKSISNNIALSEAGFNLPTLFYNQASKIFSHYSLLVSSGCNSYILVGKVKL